RAFDLLMETPGGGRLMATVAVGFVLFALLSATARYGERLLSERLGQQHVHRVRLALWDHLQRLPSTRVTGQRRGATVLRFLGDLTALKVWVSRGLASSVVAALTLVGGIAAMSTMSWRLASCLLLIVALTIALQAKWHRVVVRRLRELRRQRSRLATDVVERIACLAVIQTTNQGRRERRRIRSRSEALVRASEQAASASGVLLGGGELFAIVGIGAVLVLGATQMAAGALTPGGMVASLLLARHLGRPVRRLGRTHEQWLRAGVARRKLQQFLALDPLAEPARAVSLKKGGGAIRLSRLAAGPALRRISVRAGVGERIRLCGANGAGKSTLLRILAGLDRPTAGKVGIDGRDLARCRLRTIRSAVALVSPDLPLMRGSLKRSLTYGRPRATESEIDAVIEACDLRGLVRSLADGLATRIADGGASLSNGERHRVQLARALLTRPRVLLLDEADSFLDGRGRRAVRRVIDEYPGTVVFVWSGGDAPPANAVWRLSEGRLTVETKDEARPAAAGGESSRWPSPLSEQERYACAG
ncbi:MAG: ATP-binding cassette domain-containing protein, partial [Thermoanaerobaculia bacterium]